MEKLSVRNFKNPCLSYVARNSKSVIDILNCSNVKSSVTVVQGDRSGKIDKRLKNLIRLSQKEDLCPEVKI